MDINIGTPKVIDINKKYIYTHTDKNKQCFNICIATPIAANASCNTIHFMRQNQCVVQGSTRLPATGGEVAILCEAPDQKIYDKTIFKQLATPKTYERGAFYMVNDYNSKNIIRILTKISDGKYGFSDYNQKKAKGCSTVTYNASKLKKSVRFPPGDFIQRQKSKTYNKFNDVCVYYNYNGSKNKTIEEIETENDNIQSVECDPSCVKIEEKDNDYEQSIEVIEEKGEIEQQIDSNDDSGYGNDTDDDTSCTDNRFLFEMEEIDTGVPAYENDVIRELMAAEKGDKYWFL